MMQQFIDELSSQKTYSNSRLIINDFPGVVVFAPHFLRGFFLPLRPFSPLVTPFLARS
jgi:hypothetical protein